MSLVQEGLIVVLGIGVALGAYAMLAPRRKIDAPAAVPEPPFTNWAKEAGDDFDGLSDSARCDLVFAMAALDDERSRRLLEAALDDRSEAVAMAAAHALATGGRLEVVQAYASRVPGPRARQLLETVALLGNPAEE
jgi:hypothetical protein